MLLMHVQHRSTANVLAVLLMLHEVVNNDLARFVALVRFNESRAARRGIGNLDVLQMTHIRLGFENQLAQKMFSPSKKEVVFQVER